MKQVHPIQEFNGLKYYRKPNGYFKCEHKHGGTYMHRDVWEYHNQRKVPGGYHIHHKNHDRSDNSIENLVLISKKAHAHYHFIERHGADKTQLLNWLTAAQAAAGKWHKSDAGRAWHRAHALAQWETPKPITANCAHCCQTYTTDLRVRKRGFCSPACQSAARRASGKDDESRNCAVCGKNFLVNKYSKTKCCSRACGHKSMVEARKKNKEVQKVQYLWA